jgi:hypothetical protein
MRLLAIGRPRDGAGPADIARHTREEMRALWQLYRDGVVREMHSPGRPGAVLELYSKPHLIEKKKRPRAASNAS